MLCYGSETQERAENKIPGLEVDALLMPEFPPVIKTVFTFVLL